MISFVQSLSSADSNYIFRPVGKWGLGTSSLPFERIYVDNIYHKNGKIGFFGDTPVTQQSVTSISSPSTATASTIATTVNNLITALKNYGLLS